MISRRSSLLIILVLVLALLVSGTVLAAKEKYTFNDVDIEGTIVEIEASVKSVNKGDFSTCSYYADDYAYYLGFYTADESAGDTAEDVLAFCVDNFDDRES